MTLKQRVFNEYFQYFSRIQLLTEEVIHVEKYTELLYHLLTDSQEKILNGTLDIDKLQIIKDILLPYKIEIEVTDDYAPNGGIIKGKCNKENITIYAGDTIFNFLQNKEKLKICIRVMVNLISHELVHRGQYYLRKSDFISFYAYENNIDKKYYSDPQEIMAYAWMGIENMRSHNISDETILKKIQTDTIYAAEIGFAHIYISDLKELDIKAYNQFLKYMYMYLKNPVKYDLKIKI